MNEKTNDLSFTQSVLNSFEEDAIERTYQKGDFIIKEGEVESNLYLIEKGAVRVFYLSEHEEHTVRLGYDGSMLNSLSSFINGKPSEFYIEAMRQTKVKVLPKDSLLQIVTNDKNSLMQYTKFLELLITQQIDREIDLLITSPTERLERVLKRSPHLFQHVPLKYIASYLRMQPETLSRIRNS